MAVLLILSVLGGLGGLLFASQATAGVAIICFSCLLAIYARCAQADAQHRELMAFVRRPEARPEAATPAVASHVAPSKEPLRSARRAAGIAILVGVVALAVLAVVMGRSGLTPPTEEATSSTPIVFRNMGTSGVTFTNDSDTITLTNCTVEVSGGYIVGGFGDLAPRGKLTAYYERFETSSGAKLSESQGYARALERLVLYCNDGNGRRAIDTR